MGSSHLEQEIQKICDQYDARSVIYMLEKVLHEKLLKEAPRAIAPLQDAYRLLKQD
jgi:hypothetical protein